MINSNIRVQYPPIAKYIGCFYGQQVKRREVDWSFLSICRNLFSEPDCPKQAMDTECGLIVFDLDGTLVETRDDLARSVNHALGESGLPRHPVEVVVQFVGDGARKLVERSVGPGKKGVIYDEVLDAFLSHYIEHCTDRCTLYPGVAKVLESLAPLPLCVLTNKPLGPTERILQALGLAPHFQSVIGGDSHFGRKPDPAGLLHLIKAAGAAPESSLLVGDTRVDVLTAREARCLCAGVRYGFRPDDFMDCPPDYLIESMEDLPAILQQAPG
ncbi:MAG: haloacid dehalogenase [Planctomycetes bacterium]|nr:haloacid dehalogenase [Planctomycetota bacterium]